MQGAGGGNNSTVNAPPALLLLVNDNCGSSATSPGVYSAHLVTLRHGTFTQLAVKQNLPRMSCATYHPSCGFVFAAGRKVGNLFSDVWEGETQHETSGSGKRSSRSSSAVRAALSSANHHKRIQFSQAVLPSPGARAGQDAIEITRGGRVAVIAVGNSFYAVQGMEVTPDEVISPPSSSATAAASASSNVEAIKLLSFAQSSQVHPVIVLDVQDQSLDRDWSCLFLASGRECAVVDLFYDSTSPRLSCSKPRHETVTVASPILAAAACWPWVTVLTSDGLISVRSPSCLAIPLRTVEVGTRPNDYFVLRTLLPEESQQQQNQPWIIAISYSGQGKVLQCQPDTVQDLADRLMRHAIDAFGSNGFPRSELAEAVHASFTATSYLGPEPTAHARLLLKQYLEAVLGLADFDGGGTTGWPTELTSTVPSGRAKTGSLGSIQHHHGAFDEASSNVFSGKGDTSNLSSMLSSSMVSPPSLIAGTALLCLVCPQLSPPNASLANRAAKACAEKLGVIVVDGHSSTIVSPAVIDICTQVADRLLREASTAFSLLSGSSPSPITSIHRTSPSGIHMELTEAAVWLLRSCGKHERAINVLYERLQQLRSPEAGGTSTTTMSSGSSTSSTSATTVRTSIGSGVWSQIKYESYTATHLSELWGTRQEEACRIVLESAASKRLLEHNPRLGLSVFTALHPQNERQWKSMLGRDDPLYHPTYPVRVVALLKSIQPAVPYEAQDGNGSSSGAMDNDEEATVKATMPLPLESGRALAVTFLESAIGIITGRPTEGDEFDQLPDEHLEQRIQNLHDELSYLLLEGIIAERGDRDDDDNRTEKDTALGRLYREKLLLLMQWPLAKVRWEKLLSSLPRSFLHEHALVLGRLGRHDAALRILYCRLNSMELALKYCDLRHEQQRAVRERRRSRQVGGGLFGEEGVAEAAHEQDAADCAYLPLVRVALESDPNTERGTTAAIKVLALRRGAIDRAAALRLLPKNVPVSAVARPFLIPALVDSESQVRRLKVVSALLRARYVSLKQQLTEAQLKAQANLHIVPQLRSLNLGDPLHSTKPFKARPSSSAPSTFPDVMIIKHFFPRHLVIQAKVANSSSAVDGRALGDVAFVVAESSEEAIQPSLQVPLKALPFKTTGSAWCVLAAAPQRMDSTTAAVLTCELRYTVLSVDAAGTPLGFGGSGMVVSSSTEMGSTYVEELQDLEVQAAHFS